MSQLKNFVGTHFFNIIIILILSGRFYFIYGFTGMLKPVASKEVILLKDIIFILFSTSTLIYFRIETLEFFKKYFKPIIIISTLFLITIILHFNAKTFYILSWHYVRNIYLYVLLIPTTYILFKKNKINLEVILSSFLTLNLLFSIIQLIWFRESMLDKTRPLGVVGDPIVASVFNYLFVFKLIFEKMNIYKLSALSLAIVCIDAQASITALVCISASTFIGIYLYFNIYKNYLKKIFYFFLLFNLIVFFKVANNDLSDRMISVYYGAVAPYFGLVVDENKAETFENLSRERMQLIQQNNIFNADFKESDDTFFDFLPEDIDENNKKNLVESKIDTKNISLENKSLGLVYLFGDIYHPDYYKIDSNFISIFKNMGLLSLIAYYLLLYTIFKLARKLINKESIKICYFVVAIVFLGLFCATIYKYPISQVLYIYLGYALNKQSNKAILN